jgi:hypothetical protein
MMTRSKASFLRHLTVTSVLLCLAVPGAPHAESLVGNELVNALRHGGYVLMMCPADSPAAPPDKATADPQNTKLERQLNAVGRADAQAMGEAMRTLHLPFGHGLSSPTYRARETERFARLPYITFSELDEASAGTLSAWLRAKAAESPAAGTNRVIMTDGANIADAFGESASQIASGEALVFHPDGRGTTDQVARIKIGDWSEFVKQQ